MCAPQRYASHKRAPLRVCMLEVASYRYIAHRRVSFTSIHHRGFRISTSNSRACKFITTRKCIYEKWGLTLSLPNFRRSSASAGFRTVEYAGVNSTRSCDHTDTNFIFLAHCARDDDQLKVANGSCCSISPFGRLNNCTSPLN